MLKLIKITMVLLLLVSANFAQSPFLTLMADDGITYEAETLAYQLRVESDGGQIMDIDAVNSFYIDAKANDYLDTLIVALIMGGGVKASNDSIVRWYDLTSNNNDFDVGATENPSAFSPFYSSVNGVGGNTQPSISATLTYNQPSAYYAIVKRTGKTGYEYFWGAVGNHALLQSPPHDFYMHGGVDFYCGVAYTDDTFQMYRAIYSGTTSSIQVNNGTVTTGNAGTTNVSAANFTLFNSVTDTYFKCFVITPRLSTAKDLALKNILNTIYPTY